MASFYCRIIINIKSKVLAVLKVLVRVRLKVGRS